MTDDIEIRRRRAAWRAAHRGTKELDILVGGYAAAKLAFMAAHELGHFERFLEVGDPELQAWLLAPVADRAPVVDMAPAVDRGGAEERSGVGTGAHNNATEGGEFCDLVLAVRHFHGLT
ncbi:MAG: succinate dehydrogenase assembly factor 2 [Hyphomicrobium sp.]|jgi:antitoxin CptB